LHEPEIVALRRRRRRRRNGNASASQQTCDRAYRAEPEELAAIQMPHVTPLSGGSGFDL
jgi:hypothetical protein